MTRLRDLVRIQPKRGFELPAWLERLAAAGIVTTDPQVARRQRFTNIVAYSMAANAGSHLVINVIHALHDLMIVHVYNAIVVIAALSIPRLHRFGDNVAATTLLPLLIVGNVFIVWVLGLQSNLYVYFTLAGAILFMFGIENWRSFLAWFAVVFAVLILVMQFAPEHGLVLVADTGIRQILSRHAMINMIVINAAMIFYALAALRRAEIDLEQQYTLSEALLTTVMPASIAARLKSGAEDRIADRIENLTILFADLVGFTPAAHDLPPGEVVSYLDGLVSSFDALCETHGAEKIKTVGDTYMAVGGLQGETISGALAIGRLALAMLETNGNRPPLGNKQLGLRIGVHCGPAMAGVIGDTRFSYDVWGDAVNVASRMESHGVPGRIQVSEAFRLLVDSKFRFEERGTTDVKGIGMSRTFFLIGARSVL